MTTTRRLATVLLATIVLNVGGVAGDLVDGIG